MDPNNLVVVDQDSPARQAPKVYMDLRPQQLETVIEEESKLPDQSTRMEEESNQSFNEQDLID